jgi:hypothetical protein
MARASDAAFSASKQEFTIPANRLIAFTDYGVGIGLCIPHYDRILSETPLVVGLRLSQKLYYRWPSPLAILDQILEQYRMVPHGVSYATRVVNEVLQRPEFMRCESYLRSIPVRFCSGEVDGDASELGHGALSRAWKTALPGYLTAVGCQLPHERFSSPLDERCRSRSSCDAILDP